MIIHLSLLSLHHNVRFFADDEGIGDLILGRRLYSRV